MSTLTITYAGVSGVVYAEQVVAQTVGGGPGSTTDYDLINGGLTETSSETETLNSSNALVDTVTDYAANDSMIDQTVTTTSANGLQSMAQYYVTQNGALTLMSTASTTTSEASSGVSVETQTQTSANATLISEVVTTTTDTAGGETIVTQADNTGAGTAASPVFDTTTTDATDYNSDNGVTDPGWITETVATTSNNGTLEGEMIQVTSADRSTVTTTTLNGDGQTVEVDRTTPRRPASIPIRSQTIIRTAPCSTRW